MLKFLSFKRFGLFALLLLLSACQTPTKVVGDQARDRWLSNAAPFKLAYKKHQSLAQWQYSAKVGIVTPAESQQANMVWAYTNDGSNIVRLFGPLGLGAIKIEFDEQGVVLSDRKGELHRGDNAQHLLESIVGWSIPIDALQYWLFSLPLPNQPYQYRVNENRQVSALKQLGWTINYSGYRNYFNEGPFLARKVVAIKQVTPEQMVTVTLITKNWK